VGFLAVAMDGLELRLDHSGFSQDVDRKAPFSGGAVRPGDINRSSLEALCGRERR
jgi:hypothetical protein